MSKLSKCIASEGVMPLKPLEEPEAPSAPAPRPSRESRRAIPSATVPETGLTERTKEMPTLASTRSRWRAHSAPAWFALLGVRRPGRHPFDRLPSMVADPTTAHGHGLEDGVGDWEGVVEAVQVPVAEAVSLRVLVTVGVPERELVAEAV